MTDEQQKKYENAINILWDALDMYADPSFYHAIAILGDAPTGGFDKDVSKVDKSWGYNRKMPGALARKAQKDFVKFVNKNEKYFEVK